jgi:hypothetical protein
VASGSRGGAGYSIAASLKIDPPKFFCGSTLRARVLRAKRTQSLMLRADCASKQKLKSQACARLAGGISGDLGKCADYGRNVGLRCIFAVRIF